MSSDSEKQLVVQKFEGPVYARAGFNRLWNQVTGYVVPRQVEGFQNTLTNAQLLVQSYQSLQNAYPFTMPTDTAFTDITARWSSYVSTADPYVSGLTTYIGAESLAFSGSYTNTSTSTNMIMSNSGFGVVIYDINPKTTVNGTGTFSTTFSRQVREAYVSVSTNGFTLSSTTPATYFESNGSQYRFLSLDNFVPQYNSLYTTLLIDLYTNIDIRHSTAPPVPYTSPTFTPLISTFTDRSSAIGGNTIDAIKTKYLTTYLPALYGAVYSQVSALMTIIESYWNAIPASIKSSTFSTLTTVTADIAKFKGLPTSVTTDTVVSNIISLTKIYNTYSSNFASIATEGLRANARSVLSAFYEVWNTFPSGFSKQSDISGVANTTWTGYVSSSTTDFTGASFSSLNTAIVSSYTLTFSSYVNTTTNTSLTFTGITINGSIVVAQQSVNINPQTSTTTYSCSNYTRPSWCGSGFGATAGPVYLNTSVGGNTITFFDRDEKQTRTGQSYANYCYSYCYNKSGQPLIEHGPATPNTTTTNGSGGATVTFPISSSINIFSVIASYSPAISLTAGSQTYTGSINISTLTIGKLIYDFNNIYTALLIDLYTSINTRHSTSPPVSYTAPTFTPAINTTTDRSNAIAGTNTDTIKNNYLTNYLPAQYIRVLAQVKQMIANLQGATSTTLTLTTDTQTVNNMPATSDSTNVVTNLISLTNVYNTYNANYVSLMRDSIFSSYVLKFNIAYKRAIVYVNSSAFDATTVALFNTVANYISSTNTSTSNYTTATTSNSQITALQTSCDTGIRDILSKLITAIPNLNKDNPSDFTVPASVTTAIATSPTLPTSYSGIESYANASIFKPFDDWLSAMKLYVKDFIDAYTNNAASAGVTPSLDSATYKGFVDSSVSPWVVKDGIQATLPINSSYTTLTGNTVTVSDNIIPEVNGTYTFSASHNSQDAWKAFSNLDNSWWTIPSTVTSAWIMVEMPNPISIYQFYCYQENRKVKSPSFLTLVFEGSNDGTTFTTIHNVPEFIGGTQQSFYKTLDQPSKEYKYFRISLSNPLTTSTTANLFYTHSIAFGNYTGRVSDSKVSQLRDMLSMFRDANSGFSAIAKIRDFYNNSYLIGRRYLLAEDMQVSIEYASAAITLQAVLNKCLNYLNINGTVKTSDLQSGDESFSNLETLIDSANTKIITALIDRFYRTYSTWQSRGAILAGLPTDQGAAEKAQLPTQLATVRSTFIGSTRWTALLNEMKLITNLKINSAKALESWKTTAKGTSVTPTGLPATTGLGNLV